jgi:hypothetical protein
MLTRVLASGSGDAPFAKLAPETWKAASGDNRTSVRGPIVVARSAPDATRRCWRCLVLTGMSAVSES